MTLGPGRWLWKLRKLLPPLSPACFPPASFLGFTEASRIPLLLPSLTYRKQVLANEMVQPSKGACGQA